MGIRAMLDAHGTPHGAWQGASVGTLVRLWLCHIVAAREHCLVAVRDWVAERPQTFHTLLAMTLRDTDGPDARLGNVLSLLGAETTQATLERAMLEQGGRVSRWPTETRRLESTRVRVSHDAPTDESLCQQGHSTDHRPDWRQCKARLATLEPRGLPLGCQPVAGNRADAGWSVPAYAAAVTARGPAAVVVVGDRKMAALGTRGPLVAGGRCSLGASRPPAATDERATWRAQALRRAATWQCLETVHPKTGAVLAEGMLAAWERAPSWRPPGTQQTHTGSARVLVVRSAASHAGRRRRRARALTRLTDDLGTRWQAPGRGRQRSRSRQELARTVAERTAQAGLTGVGQTAVAQEPLPDGTPRWLVSAVWVQLAAWHALRERLGWQVYVTTTTQTPSSAPALVGSSHQQALEERGCSRVKTRHRPMRPVSRRDATRLAGLLWLWCLALRVLPLTEQRLRTALAERGAALMGLNPGSRTQRTSRPTTERVLAVLTSLTLTTIGTVEGSSHHVTPLNATQRHILALLEVPDNLYERLARPSTNFVLHLRE